MNTMPTIDELSLPWACACPCVCALIVTLSIVTLSGDVQRWQIEGLSADQALKSAWANALLDLEAACILPKGYLRDRSPEPLPGQGETLPPQIENKNHA